MSPTSHAVVFMKPDRRVTATEIARALRRLGYVPASIVFDPP